MMMRLKILVAAFLCCAVYGVCLSGCKGADPRQGTAQGGNGLTPEERKSKRGE